MAPILRYRSADGDVDFPLDREEVLIGRSREADLVIEDSAISRKHARVYRDGARWRVSDLGSKNGTRINQLEDTDKDLQAGDTIYLHEIPVHFVDESAEPAASPLADDASDPLLQTVFRSTVDFSTLAQHEETAGDPAGRLQRLLAVVTGASEVVLSSGSLEETFERTLDLVFRHLPVEGGFIMLWDDERRALQVQCQKQLPNPDCPGEALRFSRTIAEKVVAEQVAVLTRDAQLDDRFLNGESIVAMGIRSAMAAPLWTGGQVDGLICVDTRRQARAFDDFDLDLLSALGNHLAVALERQRLQHVALQKERQDRELAVAREIQMSVLPQEMPRLPGYDVAGISIPADETGGDIFDLVRLDDDRLVLLLGDATGHGIGPALSVTQVRAMLRIALRMGAGLDSAFGHINDQLEQDLSDNRFVTAFLGLLDRPSHRVTYHAGGQGPLLHLRTAAGVCRVRGATTTPLGFMPFDSPKSARSVDLEAGDILALMTDGIFEYANPEGEQFGAQRVEALLLEHQHEPMHRLIDIVLEAVRVFGDGTPQGDDITIVLLRRLP